MNKEIKKMERPVLIILSSMEQGVLIRDLIDKVNELTERINKYEFEIQDLYDRNSKL